MTTASARKVAAPATVRINKDVNSALNSAARDLKITKARLVQNALIEYLEDLADRKAIKTHRGEPTISFAELRKRLGL